MTACAFYPSAIRQVYRLRAMPSLWLSISRSRVVRRCLALFRNLGSSYGLKRLRVAFRNRGCDSIQRQAVAVQIFIVKSLGFILGCGFIPIRKLGWGADCAGVSHSGFKSEKFHGFCHTNTIPNSWVYAIGRNTISDALIQLGAKVMEAK